MLRNNLANDINYLYIEKNQKYNKNEILLYFFDLFLKLLVIWLYFYFVILPANLTTSLIVPLAKSSIMLIASKITINLFRSFILYDLIHFQNC